MVLVWMNMVWQRGFGLVGRNSFQKKSEKEKLLFSVEKFGLKRHCIWM
jgi:hypothetical protein